METLRTFQDIEVRLVGAISQPYETAVASARTCYSGRGIILPNEVSKDEKAIALRDRIAASTMEAGHITTRQHAHFVFALSGVSRQFIWSFLHSHPYYNSEQVSQRYVRVKRGSFLMPPLSPAAEKVYLETVDQQTAAYEKLITALKPPLAADFFDRFKARGKQPEKWSNAIDKRSYEVARYTLGIGTTAYLYHTVSALTLLRYAKLSRMFETSEEQRVVVEKMLAEVRAMDPLFEKEIPDPTPLEKTLEYQVLQRFKENTKERAAEFIEEFDRTLEGRYSKLVSYSHDAEKTLANAARVAWGIPTSQMSDDEALNLLLDPQKNPIIADTLNSSVFDRLSQIFHHVTFTFNKKLSHTADSQDQRHRTVMASRPLMLFHYSGKPDYITPFGVTQSPEALEIYNVSMEKSFAAVNQLLDMGVSPQSAYYLLPNAFSLRMVSTGDLLSYQHKWKLRTCYNAQEEIFRASIDEITQVREKFPRLAQHMRAPCYLRLRAGTKPFCPKATVFAVYLCGNTR